MTEKKYHAVSVGRKTGIFLTWALCNNNVNKFTGATHEGFEDIEDAVCWLTSHGLERDNIAVYDKGGEEWALVDFLVQVDQCAPLYVNLPPEQSDAKPTINNALLSYMVFSMQSGTCEKIKCVVLARFTLDIIITAKDMLWATADLNIIGDRKRRRDGAINTEKESHTNDIITALYQLDAAGNMPCIVVNAIDLGCIPRFHPEELNEISMADRMNKMEERMSSICQVMDHTVAANMVLKDQVNDMQRSSHVTYAGVAGKVQSNANVSTSNVHVPSHQAERASQPPIPRPKDFRPTAKDTHVPSTSGNKLSAPLSRHFSTSNQSLGPTSVTSDVDAGFRVPSHVARKQQRQETRRRHIVQGTRTGGGIRGAPEPRRDAFIYRVDRDTSTDMMRQHLDDMGINTHAIDCISNPDSMFKSFKVTTTVSNFRELFKPDMWPQGIRIRKYVPPRRGEYSDY